MNDTKKASGARDVRLDLFRGLANWAIFVDHIPNNIVAWLTTRNYGFSDAADLFVFVSGYTATFVYSRFMRAGGFVVGACLLLGRVWQIYVAYVLLFVAYLAAIGFVAQRYGHSHLLDEFNIRHLLGDPIETLKHGLLLEFKPLNLDVLPLYIAIMAAFPPALWALMRRPDATLAASFALYLCARTFAWNLSSYPDGNWYFNPFAWQFLFVIGAWAASGGINRIAPFLRSRAVVAIACGYLLLSFAIVTAARFPDISAFVPSWIVSAFANDKTNLGPMRLLHFLALAIVVVRFVPRNSSFLETPILRPAIVCGQRSLEVFCVGVFLSFVGHFLLELVSASVVFQVVVSLGGIAVMTGIAYYRTWTKQLRAQPFRTKPTVLA